MSRIPTPLNCLQPSIGCAYIIKNIKTKSLIRAATTCQRDLLRKGSKIKVLRAFSGEEPFFTAKIGSLRTGVEVLKFLCGAQHKKCVDATDTYEWTGISLSDAHEQNLEFDEPGYVQDDTAPVAKQVKVAKVKPIKVAKTKPVKVEKVKVAKVKVAKVKPIKVAKTKPVKVAKTEVVDDVVSVVEEEEVVAPTAKIIQSDEEFEAEINAEFEADLKKSEARLAATK